MTTSENYRPSERPEGTVQYVEREHVTSTTLTRRQDLMVNFAPIAKLV